MAGEGYDPVREAKKVTLENPLDLWAQTRRLLCEGIFEMIEVGLLPPSPFQ